MAGPGGQAGVAFARIVSGVEDERIDLTRAALAIARTEYPRLDAERYVAAMDRLAARVRARINFQEAEGPDEAEQVIPALNAVLFAEENFRGNAEDYYDPRNSFLNDVLERRLGIPITLSLVYMEVARRVGFQLFGVGMPGHFLVKHYDVEGHEVLIDAYDRGRLLGPRDCQRRLDDIYAGHLPLEPGMLAPINRRQMLTRMLNNLKGCYLAARNFRKALPMVDMLLAIYPRSPEDVKQRAVLRQSLGQMRGAVEDLETYLKMSPEASDADEIRGLALALRRRMALMN